MRKSCNNNNNRYIGSKCQRFDAGRVEVEKHVDEVIVTIATKINTKYSAIFTLESHFMDDELGT